MPSAVAVTSKATLRRLLAARNGGYNPFTTTSSGSSTTLICTTFAGRGDMVGRYFLITSGTCAGQYRRCILFDASTGTATFPDAFTATIAGSVTFEVHLYNPALFTQAYNAAVPALKYGAYRLINGHIVPNSVRLNGQSNDIYSLPRNMLKVFAITQLGGALAVDTFNRADQTPAGNSWADVVGVSGVSSERFYFSSDSNADVSSRPELAKDVVGYARISGTLNSASTYRCPTVLFGTAETYAGVIDTTNTLALRLLNGVVDLRKVDGGSESSLTTTTQTTADGTVYELRWQKIGASVKVWVDDIQLIDYTLTGTNAKYIQNQRHCLRLDKALSPATAARLDDYMLFDARNAIPWDDYKVLGDSSGIEIPAYSWRAPAGILLIEGAAPLSLLTADTTQQTIASDSTLSIQMAFEADPPDPASEKVLLMCESKLFGFLASNIDWETGGLTPASDTFRNLSKERELASDAAMGMTMTRVRPKGAQL